MLLLAAVHGLASAATLTVGPSGDFATIGEAVAIAVEGDRIEIAAGTYAESVVIDKSLTLVGEGTLSTFLAAAGPLVNVADGEVALEGLALAPTSGRAVEVRQAALDLRDVTISAGRAGIESGGGVYAIESVLSIADSRFDGNSAVGGHGGHVYAYASTTTISSSAFNTGRAEKGGALYAIGGSLDVTDTTFDTNEVRADDEASRGGAIRAQDAEVTVTGCYFDSNGAENGYGGAIATSGGSLAAVRSTFTASVTTEYYGGAIAAYNTALTIDGSDFVENAAQLDAGAGYGHAGAVLVYGAGVASFVVTGSTFTGNFAEGYGGAMRVESGAATVTDSAFTDNTSAYGGAMHLPTVAAVTIEGTAFSGNEAPHAGAIRWRPESSTASLTIRRSAFVGNVADGGYGGAVYGHLGGELVVTGTTFTGNAAVVGGALMVSSTDRVTAQNNVFCANDADGSGSSDGGAATVLQSGDGGTNSWTNNVFAENEARGRGGALNQLESSSAWVANNTFVENEAGSGGAASFRLTPGAFVNNVVAWSAGDGVAADATSAITPMYGDFYDNVPANVGDALDPTLLDASNLKIDPALTAYTANGDCADDQLWLRATSPLIDAGDPTLSDPDDSRSDIGAYGGPDADPAAYADADADGWVDLQDCAPDDGAIFPGAPETPYDGLDQDCDGADEIDVDGDAWDAAQAGGEDCDDTDAAVNPGAEDVWYDGVDADCDGADDYDQDGDGHATAAGGGGDCADLDPAVNPGAADAVGDGIDADCDGADGTSDGNSEGEDPKECGCDGSGAGGSGLLGLIALALARRRR